MKIANQYNLFFRIGIYDGRKMPTIDYLSTKISNTSQSLVAFLQECDVEHTKYLISEINELDFSFVREDGLVNDFTNRNEIIQIFIYNKPKRVEFHLAEDAIMPLEDFLEVLQEWLDLLNQLPYEYRI